MRNLILFKAITIVLGLSILFNTHYYLLKGNHFGDSISSYSSVNLYIRALGGLFALFQACGMLLTSLKPISTQNIYDPASPHLISCFDPFKISLAPLGSGRSKLIKELNESDTFCFYLRDPPKQ